jgi:pyridoxamine 5'-phosphate oxidase
MKKTEMTDQQSAIPADDPIALFDAWFAEAQASEPNDPNAMALATATPAGAPSVRMVLLKGHEATQNGGGSFTFYTNSESRKGGEIRSNMQASLLFHWKSLRRQIRIEGPLTEVTPEQADAYFHSRGHKSQVASAASDQSRPLSARGDYFARYDEIAAQYPEGTNVPRPPHWTGFTLEAKRMEYWLDRPGRMHDRRLFTRTNTGWDSGLLYP